MVRMDFLDPPRQQDQFRQFAPVRLVMAAQDMVDEFARFARRGKRLWRQCGKLAFEVRQIDGAPLGRVCERQVAAAAIVEFIFAENCCRARQALSDFTDLLASKPSVRAVRFDRQLLARTVSAVRKPPSFAKKRSLRCAPTRFCCEYRLRVQNGADRGSSPGHGGARRLIALERSMRGKTLLRGRRFRGEESARIEAQLIARAGAESWRVILKPAGLARPGDRLRFGESLESTACLLGFLDAEVVSIGEEEAILAFAFTGAALDEALERLGRAM
jgi:hypothetical protein